MNNYFGNFLICKGIYVDFFLYDFILIIIMLIYMLFMEGLYSYFDSYFLD